MFVFTIRLYKTRNNEIKETKHCLLKKIKSVKSKKQKIKEKEKLKNEQKCIDIYFFSIYKLLNVTMIGEVNIC